MNLISKILVVVLGLGAAGGGIAYLVQVNNTVTVQSPPPPSAVAPPEKTREQLAAEYRAKAGSQKDLKPLEWGSKN